MEPKKTIQEQARARIEQLKEAQAEQQKKQLEAAQKRAKSLVSNMVIGTILITVIAVLFGVIGFYYLAMLIVVAMLPGLLAYMTDVKPGKLASKTVLTMNIAGLFPVIVSIVISGAPDASAKAALQSPQTWLLVYGFSFCGWFLVFMIPQIIKFYLEIQGEFTIKKMQHEQETLEKEWGVEVRQAAERRQQLVKTLAKKGKRTAKPAV